MYLRIYSKQLCNILGKIIVTIAIVVVVGFLALGIVVFLSCKYCRKRRNLNLLPPQIRQWSDEIDGLKGLRGTLGRTYAQVPGEPTSSSEDQENKTNSFCLPSDSENVSIVTSHIPYGIIKFYSTLI